MKAQAVLQLARAAARREGCTVEPVPGRGKGAHQLYAVLDADRNILATFTLTHHPRDLSIGVLRAVEKGLESLFGERWMEKR
jgi:hypothetical protein